MASAKAPHKAIILIKMEVHDVLPTGEVSGHIVPKDELKSYGLSPSMVVSVNGFDRNECLRKLKELINEFR